MTTHIAARARRHGTLRTLVAVDPRTEFVRHAPLLRAMAYRMLGTMPEAEDVVQEAFVRLIERGPRRTDSPLRPWLVRVTMNLARDGLRRRRRRAYDGPWLPGPVEAQALASMANTADERADPHARYDALESASFAFLLALEALTPGQRAVVLLRDVFDHSVRETAEVMDISEANVKTTHLRARRALAPYDERRYDRPADTPAATIAALQRFLQAVAAGDAEEARAALSPDAITANDAGGHYQSARRIIRGQDRVARFYLGLATKTGVPARFAIRPLNGMPGLITETPDAPANKAPKMAILADVDRSGAIRAIYAVLSPDKLRSVGPVQPDA